MTFRTRLLLIFSIAVVASVGIVEWLAIDATRRAFEQMESRRVDALVGQFQKEFQRRGADIVRAVDGIAASDAAFQIAGAPDPSAYYSDAGPMAAARGLTLLELVADDGTIVSSAEWPARFGYKEDWLLLRQDWQSTGAFLRREELPEGMTLALVAVATVKAGDRKLYVVGGQQLDAGFLSTLVLPEGMRALLYRDLQPRFAADQLLGPGPRGPELPAFLSEVESRRAELSRTIGDETFHALPLDGYEGNLLGVLLIGSSRAELQALERTQRSYGLIAAAAGILIGILMSAWATARVTRPVQRLAESAGKVAAGNWNTTVDASSSDEVGQLARAFNRMTHELMEQRDRLVQTERVAAWRELARRLAHELKNPLFPLQITVENMQRARERSPEQFDEVFREGTHTLLAELANLKQIIARFSDFAKMPAPRMEPVDFNKLAADTTRLFEAQFAQAHVTARLELDPALPPVQADPEQMTRALRNLVLNAIDAMPQGGTLTVRTVALGAAVRLEVSDTGQGLTPEECARLFTPYYTTKTHGTGLGLAIVQSVVSDHHGRIAVESEPGKGATFRIDLG
jgi:two-component system nitrogen regulation sensor histidine kinase NtrY